jgi:tyrosyl-tRNA synthetase
MSRHGIVVLMDLAQELKARGLAEQSSAPIEKILEKKRVVYFGADPTADSLHVGHLVPLLIMKRLADAGHSIILLVGGGTGMIGDPRAKGERILLDMKVIEKNKRALRDQMQRIIGRKVRLVDNADWLLKVGMVAFLRDIGKYFSVNELIKRDLIKRRLEDPDESISYTEFSYSLLQAYDYLKLHEKYGADLQVGGADQWTNILSGVDLIRRKTSHEVFAFTGPIVTDANGKKFGKSEGNAVWLDPKKTSPYTLYQFWLNLPDEGLESYFHFYTFMPLVEISALNEMHRRNPSRRDAQKMLAHKITELVHGKDAALRSIAVSEALFGERALGSLSKEERAVILTAAPSVIISQAQLDTGYGVVDALVNGGLATSKSEARRLIEGKGVSVSTTLVESADAQLSIEQFENGLVLLKKGKQDKLVVAIDK